MMNVFKLIVQESTTLELDVSVSSYNYFYLFPFFLYEVNVEMEIVLPGHLTVVESHDVALALQHKIESIADVERAFVHVRVFQFIILLLYSFRRWIIKEEMD
jgi:hypothetical protein